MASRIKGQEVEIRLVVDGVIQGTLTDIRSFDVTPKFEKLEEQYLGETFKRYDEIFNGVDFSMELHIEDSTVLAFMKKILERATRRVPGTKVNIKAKLNFANGQTPIVLLNDCFFEDVPLNFGGRSEYGQVTISGSCSNFDVLGIV